MVQTSACDFVATFTCQGEILSAETWAAGLVLIYADRPMISCQFAALINRPTRLGRLMPHPIVNDVIASIIYFKK